MEYSNNDFRNYELYHHGILGQKWGRKNGPPYPLDASDHSASEKKAGWRKSLDGGNSNDSSSGSSKTNYKQKKKQLDQELKDRKKKIQKEYDDEIDKIESKYKNSRSKISDADAAREKAASEKYNKAWDESDRKYKQDLSNLKTERDSDGPMSRREGRNQYRERNRKIQSEYDSEIEKIESKYKKGQTLSDEDIAREKAASDKYNKAWDESERQYRDYKKTMADQNSEKFKNNVKNRLNAINEKREAKKEQKEVKKINKDVNKNWYKAYNKATDEFNKKIVEVNKKYDGADFGRNFETDAGQKYVKEVGKMWRDLYSEAFDSTFSIPEGYGYNKDVLPYFTQYDRYILR